MLINEAHPCEIPLQSSNISLQTSVMRLRTPQIAQLNQ